MGFRDRLDSDAGSGSNPRRSKKLRTAYRIEERGPWPEREGETPSVVDIKTPFKFERGNLTGFRQRPTEALGLRGERCRLKEVPRELSKHG